MTSHYQHVRIAPETDTTWDIARGAVHGWCVPVSATILENRQRYIAVKHNGRFEPVRVRDCSYISERAEPGTYWGNPSYGHGIVHYPLAPGTSVLDIEQARDAVYNEELKAWEMLQVNPKEHHDREMILRSIAHSLFADVLERCICGIVDSYDDRVKRASYLRRLRALQSVRSDVVSTALKSLHKHLGYHRQVSDSHYVNAIKSAFDATMIAHKADADKLIELSHITTELASVDSLLTSAPVVESRLALANKAAAAATSTSDDDSEGDDSDDDSS